MQVGTLAAQHQRICWLIAEADKFGADQMELRAHWARYLCVLSSGFLENSLKEIYGKYARTRSDETVGNYVERALISVRNPKANRFVDTAGAFNRAWEPSLANFLDSDGNREAIDAIMANRHLIAHGKDSNITLVQLKDYLARSVRVLEFIEDQCGLGG